MEALISDDYEVLNSTVQHRILKDRPLVYHPQPGNLRTMALSYSAVSFVTQSSSINSG